MDPFTERMLERARARREKLNAQLNNIGQLDVSTTKKPVPTTKLNSKLVDLVDKSSTIMKAAPKIASPEETFDKNKENSASECQEVNFRNSARSRLKRLGALYSNNLELNNPEEMPSPIHRSELKAYKEDSPKKKTTPVHTVQRLAALADHINHWEDDVSQPKGVAMNEEESLGNPFSCCSPGKEMIGRCGLQGHKEVIGVEPTAIDSPQKTLVWDREVIANLESQGFRPSASGSRLVYDYANDSSQGCTKEMMAPSSESVSQTEPSNKKESPLLKHQDTGAKILTPKQTPSHGSVLHRVALFESPTRSPKAKDPAELSVAERKALFEKNKGQALVPKAAFSMAVSAKQLASSPKKAVPSCHELAKRPEVNEPNSLKIAAKSLGISVLESHTKVASSLPETREVCENPPTAANKVLDKCHIFEKGKPVQNLENDILKIVKSERQRELDMLASRWNHQRETTTKATALAKSAEKAQMEPNGSQPSKAVPLPPPLPSFSSSLGRQGVLLKGGASLPSSPVSTCLPSTSPHSERISSLASMRKIKVSPAKPGCLYPSLSDIEVTGSEMDFGESEGENESFGDLERERDNESSCSSSSGSFGAGDTSFGREIFQAAGINDSFGKKRHGGTLSTAEKAVFDEMDELLDEAIAEEDGVNAGPTPPKRKSADSATSGRNTWKGTGINFASPTCGSNLHSNEEELVSSLVQKEDELGLPLLHTISFYRKQQAQASPYPSVAHHKMNHHSSNKGQSQASSSHASQACEQSVQEKMKSLLDEVSIQQTIISQASQALNLCSSTIEFSESAEQVEGERLLLIATHRRQAALNEIQRLKVEGTLWPKQSAELDTLAPVLEKGDLEISGINLPLKKEFLQKVVNGDVDFTHHFVCLCKHQEKVIATEMISTANVCRSQGRFTPSLHFNNCIHISGLYSDFKVTLEIYGLQVRKEVLSHEAKYHIRKDNSKIRITPKKLLKQESNLIMPIVQSPAGPLAVRSTAFTLAGYVVFSLRELSRVQWTLNKVPYSSPLEGVVQMKLKCQLEQNAEERGFLTMFEDISGFGAWHRRWCLLHDDRLSFWKYPEDEKKKEPIGWINLNACSNENVGPVPRHICARPNTFLLETKRTALPEDRDSLVLVTSTTYTTIRHLLSADSKEERQLWCSQINKAIRSLRAWGPRV